MGLITPGGGYAEDATAMMDCCDPEVMQMMMDSPGGQQNDCMDSSGCQMPEFGCANNMNSAIGMSAALDSVITLTNAMPPEYTSDTVLQGISPGLIAPPPIA